MTQLTRNPDSPRVLCIAKRIANLAPLLRSIRQSGYEVLLAFTADQGVAACMSAHVVAVVLDSAFLKKADWSVAKSVKLVCPSLPILLVHPIHAFPRKKLPLEIDAVARNDSPEYILGKLRQLITANQPRHCANGDVA